VQDLITAMATVSTAVNNGELTAEEAAHIVHLLEDMERFTLSMTLRCDSRPLRCR
jgi:hypothetical protein